ncbi:hypothetical protein [Actinocorallia longicatena]|uniref:Uncharacterized protein n=1 Tax=Actinocorallia longicatena TaxID=111803 RepID=A0ABP6QIM7_9ACTN
MTEALVDEAMKKSGLVWLELDRARPAWHLWHDGAAYVLTGGADEQPLPGLPEASTVTVLVRSKDKGSQLVRWVAEVAEIPAGTPEWDEITPLLFKERLNARPQPEDEHERGKAHNPVPRWSHQSWLLKLTPTGEILPPPDGYAAVRPVETPAANTTRKPFMIGGKRRKIDR